MDLEEQNNDRIRDLVKEYAAKKMEKGTVGQKIGALYRLYMDSVARNKMGYEPIVPALNKVKAIKNRKQYLQTTYELAAKGYGGLMFSYYLGQDSENSSKYIFGVTQGVSVLNLNIILSLTSSRRLSWQRKKFGKRLLQDGRQ